MSPSRWDPFRELNTLQERMNRLFDEANQGWRQPDPSGTTAWSPAVDIYETEKEIVVKAELPGLGREDIGLSLDGRILTLSGERPFERATTEENYHRIERSYGMFQRSFTIPAHVDQVSIRADHKNGVLTIILPKSEKSRSRPIAIRQ